MSSAPADTSDDKKLVAALVAGDQRAFRQLTRQLYGSMVRVARLYCHSEAVAQEVIQETWMGVLKGLPQFEHRSTLKTWIFRILSNRARSRAKKEGRTVSLDALMEEGGDTADPSRFDSGGGWQKPPASFDPERCANDSEFLTALGEELQKLPKNQQAVVMMRDVEGLSTQEVSDALELSIVHVRVLLHRGRTRLRARLEQGFRVD